MVIVTSNGGHCLRVQTAADRGAAARVGTPVTAAGTAGPAITEGRTKARNE